MIKCINSLIPFPGYKAMNLFGIIFIRRDKVNKMRKRDFNHEAIHTAQMKELLYVGFYLIYILEWLWQLLYQSVMGTFDSKEEYLDIAYRAISFEREAYNHETDFNYLNTRRHFAMWRKENKSNG